MKEYKFEAEIKKVDGKDASYIEIPFDVEKEFGAKRIKVKASFDGIEYRGSIVKMGLPCYMIGLTKDIRNKIGKTYGDTVKVIVERDVEERIIEIPEELKLRFNDNKDAYDFYNDLSYSQKKKYVTWINSAKKKETFEKRINDTIIKLSNKEKM
ncbi:YdeI/OmpD-associated family protein [Clostridium sp. NSJ-145]|uniref:YdeI/OmpD-associated family protein n=1 Tax=Clostridium sp. NSJ-145 TaxID=2897777 RepID=UPI001E651B53|nr:YdeI/OmpD-associated family protein [Clostridium sp. NSJ-145]